MSNQTLESWLTEQGVSLPQAKEIYRGKDHACRCGCKGKYYSQGGTMWTKTVRAVQTSQVRLEEASVVHRRDGSVEHINLPYGEKSKDRCFCLYF